MFAPLVTQVPAFLTIENQFPNICNMKVGSALYFMLYIFYAIVLYTNCISNYYSHHPGANKDTSSISYVTILNTYIYIHKSQWMYSITKNYSD